MITIHSDKPIIDGNNDLFQRYEFAKRIAKVISSQPEGDSLVVGLYGKWGEGKTTLMNFIQSELPTDSIVINFNPWLFSDENHLLKAFFEGLAGALNKESKNSKEKIGGFLAEYADSMGVLTQFLGFNTKGLESLGKKMGALSTEKLKERIDKYIEDSGKKIYVFIDDIDRLDINEIQSVFKLVKLVGNFPNTCYVMAFDNEMVSAALAPKYTGSEGGHNFLEKIIQLPILIPKASLRSLRQFTLNQVLGVLENEKYILSESELGEFIEVFDSSFLPLIDNPRGSVRYSNSVAFSVPILKGLTNPSDLLAIEGCKIFFPDLYSFIRNNKRIIIGVNHLNDKLLSDEEIIKIIEKVINSYDDKKKKASIELVTRLFPRIYEAFKGSKIGLHSIHQNHDLWAREKRMCSGRYFDRYFAYSMDKDEIPDTDFEELIELSKELNSADDIAIKINQLITSYSAFNFMQILRIYDPVLLTDEQIHNLGIAISKVGNSFPKEEDVAIATTFVQMAKILKGYVRKTDKEKKLQFAFDLLDNAETVDFAIEITNWLTEKEKKDYPDVVFNEKEEVLIKNKIIQLFKDKTNLDNLFTSISERSIYLVLKWWGESKKHTKSAKPIFNKKIIELDFAMNLLKSVTPTIIHYSTGKKGSYRYRSGFNKTIFDLLTKIVDVNLLNKTLESSFGMNPYEGSIEDMEDLAEDNIELDDKILVSVFQWYLKESQKIPLEELIKIAEKKMTKP